MVTVVLFEVSVTNALVSTRASSPATDRLDMSMRTQAARSRCFGW